MLKTFKALNGLLCADVPLRNYSLTHSVEELILNIALLDFNVSSYSLWIVLILCSIWCPDYIFSSVSCLLKMAFCVLAVHCGRVNHSYSLLMHANRPLLVDSRHNIKHWHFQQQRQRLLILKAEDLSITEIYSTVVMSVELRRVEFLLKLHLRATGCHLPLWDHTELPATRQK